MQMKFGHYHNTWWLRVLFSLDMRRNGYLWMSFQAKLWHCHWIQQEGYFGNLVTFSVVIIIVQPQILPYFYFWIIWPNDLEIASRVVLSTMIISTKFEVYMSICFQVMMFFSANILYYLVTLTFWPWTIIIHRASHDQTLYHFWASYDWWISILELWTLYYHYFQHELWPLCSGHITWSICKGSILTAFLKPWPIFICSLFNLNDNIMKTNCIIHQYALGALC